MKNLFKAVIISLLLISWANAAVINSVATFKTNFAAGGAHTIVAGTYVLDANVAAGEALSLVPTGNVIIDGNAICDINIADVNSFIGDTTGTYSMSFQNMGHQGMIVEANSADVNATFYYCNFRNNLAGAGDVNNAGGLIAMDGNGKTLLVRCYDCNAYGNLWDGFSLKGNLGSTTGRGIMYLYNCNGIDNGVAPTAAVQGATIHEAWHRLIIDGGNYSGNGDQGIASGGGSYTVIKNAHIYHNTCTSATSAQVDMTLSTLIMDNCTIDQVASGKTNILIAASNNKGYEISNCIIEGSALGGDLLRINSTVGYGTIRNCIFKNQTAVNTNAINSQTAGLTITNCTFYNNTTHIKYLGYSLTCYNNIFHTSTTAVNVIASWLPYTYGNSGYNCFYTNTNNFASSYDSLSSTDLTVDPQFRDASNDDFRLLRNSPLINAGKSLTNIGHSTIGAFQPRIPNQKYRSRDNFDIETIY